jgi:hypothetical protein
LLEKGWLNREGIEEEETVVADLWYNISDSVAASY